MDELRSFGVDAEALVSAMSEPVSDSEPEDDLVTWLRLRLDERERHLEHSASACDDPHHISDPQWKAVIVAGRKLLALYEANQDITVPPLALVVLDEAVQVFAEAFADQPGYREEWRPE
ncbi:DUF6221 family protein [Paractinoplanes maris]|uniref:DUF6221 family protein n=1 Tax=Paractinoplanes maris TaxID=1734446 RepID=UPI00201FF72E|nr:DUF6221 family protein [Actinoplanes maris]